MKPHRPTCAVILMALVTSAAASDVTDLFPPEAMRDVASLEMEILRSGPWDAGGGGHQFVEIAFTSFEWAGENWRHNAFVLLPRERPERFRGAGVVISTQDPRGKFWVEMAQAAVEMGIPTIVVGTDNPGGRYGQPNEGETMGYGNVKFGETGDPRWLGYPWLAKVMVRAITAGQQVEGFDAQRFVVTGCSKRGVASWIAAGVDDRIIGAYPMCWNSGNMAAWLELKAQRWGPEYAPGWPDNGNTTLAPAFMTTQRQLDYYLKDPRGRLSTRYIDPYEYRDRLAGKNILYATGTNDPLFHPSSDRVFLSHMHEGVGVLLTPNATHSPNTPTHRTGWKMWLAHCLADRPVSKIDAQASHADGKLRITARVDTPHKITAVRVHHASDERGAFLNARWRARPASADGEGRFTATLSAPDGFVTGFFVEVQDIDADGLPGVITTGMMEWPNK